MYARHTAGEKKASPCNSLSPKSYFNYLIFFHLLYKLFANCTQDGCHFNNVLLLPVGGSCFLPEENLAKICLPACKASCQTFCLCICLNELHALSNIQPRNILLGICLFACDRQYAGSKLMNICLFLFSQLKCLYHSKGIFGLDFLYYFVQRLCLIVVRFIKPLYAAPV